MMKLIGVPIIFNLKTKCLSNYRKLKKMISHVSIKPITARRSKFKFRRFSSANIP